MFPNHIVTGYWNLKTIIATKSILKHQQEINNTVERYQTVTCILKIL